MSTEIGAETILRRNILPALFPPAEERERPQLVVLLGASGVQPRRALARAGIGDAAFLSIETLRPFHPDYAPPGRRSTADRSAEVDEDATTWLQACITHARRARRSIVLGGGLSPALALAVGERYRADGFDTHLVAVAAPPGIALLASVSLAAERARAGVHTELEIANDHDTAPREITELLQQTAVGQAFTRITVFDDRGTELFDGTEPGPAEAAFTAGSHRDLTSLESAQWLGELRRTTEFVLSQRTPPPLLVDALVELHDIALQSVTPALPVPRESDVTSVQEQRLATRLTTLRRIGADSQDRAAVTAPTITPVPRREGPGL